MPQNDRLTTNFAVKMGSFLFAKPPTRVLVRPIKTKTGNKNKMSIQPPLTELPIKTANAGFYRGFSVDVTVVSKIIISILVVWCIFWPTQSGRVLGDLNSIILANFAAWYIWVVAFFIIVCLGLALWPAAGRLNLGQPGEGPEFSNFSWFSMMFGAGIGVGMLTWAVAEPVAHFGSNPETIQGLTNGGTADNVRMAYKWSFLHWGLGAWACYAVAGLALAFFSYRRGLPLTIRSSLTPLFGASLSGKLGHLIDIVAVVATILGVAQTLGFGVEQFVAGLTRIGIGGLMDADGGATFVGIVVALLAIMGASTLSALSGVGRGIKWLSNINMVLSIFLLGFFILFGATWFGATAFFVGIWDYLVALPSMSLNVWSSDGVEGSESLNLKFYFAYQCLASLRVRRRILATSAQAVELSIVRSQSLANRRHLPSHAKVRSTTHRLGSRTKPFALSGRLTVSSVHSSPMACRSLSPAYPPSVKIWRKHGNFLPAALSRSGAPSRSWMLAA